MITLIAPEHQLGAGIDHIANRFGPISEPRQHITEQKRNQHDRKDVAPRERVDDRIGNDVQDELNDRLFLSLAGI